MKASCISHAPKGALVILRDDYKQICEGDNCAAAVLGLFEYWTNVKAAMNEQIVIENLAAAQEGKPQKSIDLWIYKTQPAIKEELLNLFGETKIANALRWLVENEMLLTRTNPDYKWDKTTQYQLNVEVVQHALDALKLRLRDNENTASTPPISRHQKRENTAAIPETTTETTEKTTVQRENSADTCATPLTAKPSPPPKRKKKGKPEVDGEETMARAWLAYQGIKTADAQNSLLTATVDKIRSFALYGDVLPCPSDELVQLLDWHNATVVKGDTTYCISSPKGLAEKLKLWRAKGKPQVRIAKPPPPPKIPQTADDLTAVQRAYITAFNLNFDDPFVISQSDNVLKRTASLRNVSLVLAQGE